MMQAPGAEYIVILNDRQLREAQTRPHSRTSTPDRQSRTTPLSWIRQIRLNPFRSQRTMVPESAPQPARQQIAAQAAPVFGSLG
jgi:hypothetical protein